jgi:cytochrome bd ubiquinol oxidase subunit II
MQGIVLGAYIQGFEVEGRVFSGSSWSCFNLFSLTTGIALIFGYGLLGACWLVLKTEGELQKRVRRQGVVCLFGVVAFMLIVSLWTPMMSSDIAGRWFSWPNIVLLTPVPLIGAACAAWTLRGLVGKSELTPFIGAAGLFLTSYLGVVISLFPNIVPHHYTIWEAASSPNTQAFLLVGTLFLLPVILMYVAWSYWVFRGKVRGDMGYH